ncbi:MULTISPECIES: GMC family oxidoreductase [unclassified Roseovarius]|uniref:GMC family oxidoreductase n=1 Tax=unclassified Roseovarius TaxID=2614913 RepID=UPI00273E69A6|nr:GMC family oxidoreductase [Roseovarius sp. MMSF_3350]
MAIIEVEYEPDIVVVGAGVAGGMVADKASAAGLKVLILESGPRLRREDLVQNWRHSARTDFMAPYPQPAHAPVPDPSNWGNYLIQTGPDPYNQQFVRGVGGTTWHWAAATWRFLPNDFKLRGLYGVGRDWPIGYRDLEPYYLEAETLMGVAGQPGEGLAPRSAPFPMEAMPVSYMDRVIAERLNPHGYLMQTEPVARNRELYDGRPPCCGNNNCMPICPIGAQYSGNLAVEKAERQGARVITEAVAHFIEQDANGDIVAVRYLKPDRSEHRVRARSFVLAANGIEIPRLMLMSAGEDAPEGIGNSSGQVGRNLMDHPGTQVVFDMPMPVWPGRGPQENTSILKFRDGDHRRRMSAKKLHLWNGSSVDGVAEEAIDEGLTGEALATAVRDRAARRCAIANFHEQLPDPENRLTLSPDKTDPLGLPRPSIHYSIGDYVRDSAQHTAGMFRDIVDKLEASLVSIEDGSEGFRPNNHIMGSTIMGDDPTDSVVDGDCRSHDHPNLYIASSSVFASGACVNSTLSIAALSLRIGDRVVADLT